MGWGGGWGGIEDEMGWNRMGWWMGLHVPAQYCLLLNAPPSHNLEMKHLPGADPELVLLNHRYEELEVSGQHSTCCRGGVWGCWCPRVPGCNPCVWAENPPERHDPGGDQPAGAGAGLLPQGDA